MAMYNKEKDKTYVDPKVFIQLENQLQDAKEMQNIEAKPKLWVRIGDFIVNALHSRQPVALSRRKYIKLAVFGGIFGAHRFYAKQYGLGILYLLTCFTGFSVAMTVIDLMIALPKEQDGNGMMKI